MPRFYHIPTRWGPELTALIWFRTPGLGLYPRGYFEFDFSPVASDVWGDVHMQILDAPGDRVEAKVFARFTDVQREMLRPGFQFRVLPTRSSKARNMPKAVGFGVVKKVHERGEHQNLADAEVIVDMSATALTPIAVSGQVFEFNFPRLAKCWKGHLDGEKRLYGWPLEIGNAYLCLHEGSDPLPSAAQPLLQGDEFDVLTAGTLVGRGVVARVVPQSTQLVTVCEPLEP